MGVIILNLPPKNPTVMDWFLEPQVSIVAFCRFPEKLISMYFPHTLQNKDDHLICLHFFLHLRDYINIWSILQIFEILCISLHCNVCSKYVAQIKLYKNFFSCSRIKNFVSWYLIKIIWIFARCCKIVNLFLKISFPLDFQTARNNLKSFAQFEDFRHAWGDF